MAVGIMECLAGLFLHDPCKAFKVFVPCVGDGTFQWRVGSVPYGRRKPRFERSGIVEFFGPVGTVQLVRYEKDDFSEALMLMNYPGADPLKLTATERHVPSGSRIKPDINTSDVYRHQIALGPSHRVRLASLRGVKSSCRG